MDFEKKYPITQRPGKFILVQWLRGYKQVDLYYEDKLIGTVQGTAKLQKGVTLSTDAGIIKLKLSEKPITLDVIVDGYHSPVNVSHPEKELRKASAFFWIIATFAILGTFLEGIQFGLNRIGTIITLINLAVVTIYIVSAIGVSKAQPWAFYLGFSLYCLLFLFAFLSLFGSGIFVLLAFLIRVVLFVFLIMNVKNAAGTFRHKRFANKSTDYLLDQ